MQLRYKETKQITLLSKDSFKIRKECLDIICTE